MEIPLRPDEDQVVKDYLDKLTVLTRIGREQVHESRHIRLDARGEQLNDEALLMLAQIRAQNEHDGGEEFFNTLIEYAYRYGMKLRDINVVEGQVMGTGQELPPVPLPARTSSLRSVAALLSERAALTLQLALGVTVAAAFLLLLH